MNAGVLELVDLEELFHDEATCTSHSHAKGWRCTVSVCWRATQGCDGYTALWCASRHDQWVCGDPGVGPLCSGCDRFARECWVVVEA